MRRRENAAGKTAEKLKMVHRSDQMMQLASAVGNQEMVKIIDQGIIQREKVKYMRAVASVSNAQKEIVALKYQNLGEERTEKVEESINNILNGFVGMATSVFVSGMKYIYPVGYQLELDKTEDSQRVLSNYKTDGNTSTLKMNQGKDILIAFYDQIKGEIGEGDTKDELESAIVYIKDHEVDEAKAAYAYQLLLQIIASLDDDKKANAIHLLQSKALEGLRKYYDDKGKKHNEELQVSNPGGKPLDNYQGQGIKTSSEIYGVVDPTTYGETNLIGYEKDVTCTWYDDEENNEIYGGRPFDESWKGDGVKQKETVIHSRKTAAEAISGLLSSAKPFKALKDLG